MLGKSKEGLSPTARGILLMTLFMVAFLERTVFDLGPNFELVTTTMILTSYYLGEKQSFWLTLVTIAATDRITGNSPIFLFTWSGFLIPALFSKKITEKLISFRIPKITSLTSSGLISNSFFYFWTNLGVWLLDLWGMYTKDLPGLIKCYINALPFLKNQVLSSLIFIPLGFLIIEFTLSLSKNFLAKKFSSS